MSNELTGEEVLAARIYLKLTQVKFSIAIGLAGVTTINRWENGHTSPSTAWATLVEDYLMRTIGDDWRVTVRTERFTIFKRLKDYADSKGIKLQLSPGASINEIEAQHAETKKEARRRAAEARKKAAAKDAKS